MCVCEHKGEHLREVGQYNIMSAMYELATRYVPHDRGQPSKISEKLAFHNFWQFFPKTIITTASVSNLGD